MTKFAPLLTGFALFAGTNGQTLSDDLQAITGTCEDSGDVTHVDWDDLLADASNAPNANMTMAVDGSTLTMSVDVMADFVGWATADNGIDGYGMMYLIDFESHDAASTNVRAVGTCANRNGAMRGADWDEQWDYSADADRGVTSGTGAYVGNRYWSLTSKGGDCGVPEWAGSWSWFDLMNCTNAAGDDDFFTIEESDTWVNMSGAVTVNLVSPLGLDSDNGFYRVYQLISQPFLIAVEKTVNVVSSTGINLFTVTIIAVFKEDAASDLEMVVLTESADFLQLGSAQIVTEPTPYTLAFGNSGNDISGGCMSSGNLCLQLFSLETADVTCPTVLTGNYNFQFALGCNPAVLGYTDQTALCNDYIAEYSGVVQLAADLDWEDNVCDPEVFLVDFTATIDFYTADDFATVLGTGDQYNLGDTAFVEVVVGDPANFALSGLDFDNAWICTTSPDNEPLTVQSGTGFGGCMGGLVDVGYPKHIVSSGVADSDPVDGTVLLYGTDGVVGTNALRFSFPIEFTVERTNLYVHVQATVDITPEARRRRQLLQTDTASSTAHFAGAVGLADGTVADDDGNDDEELPGDYSIYELIGIAVAVTSAVCIVHFLVFGVCYRKKSQQRKEMELNLQKSVESQSAPASQVEMGSPTI